MAVGRLTLTGTCPVCEGSTRRPVPAESSEWKTILAGYDPDTDTLACINCGGQTMSGTALGVVPLNWDGQPCRHEYIARQTGRCLHEFTCKHCPYRYVIDSGD